MNGIKAILCWILIGLCVTGSPLRAEGEIGMDWWSIRPVVRPAVPQTGSPRARTPIDHFIIAKQSERGLAMSPEADRRTLIRRLFFDLIGLPPSPEEVAAFVSDTGADAYQKLVERLLVSPRYGERWARHWLDVVHYGDTHGYDKDKLRPNAYPYRDYVIRAFNEDKPYSRFVREQLAGDVLWPGTVDGVVATGFIAAGPWDFIGHAEVPEEKIDGKVARHLDRDDMVATTMNSFCSLTVQCAQCHDHKRDPVSMEDYYSLQAVFAALDRADRPYDADPAVEARRLLLSDSKKSIDESLAPFEKKRSEHYGYHSQVAGEKETVKWVQIDLGGRVAIDEIVVAPAEEYGFADFGFPHRFKIEVADEPDFTAPQMISDHTAVDYARPGGGLIEFDAGGIEARYVRVTATRLWSRRMRGQPESGDWIFALGELQVLAAGQGLEVKEVTALDSIEALPRWSWQNLVDGEFAGLVPKEGEQVAALRAERERLESELATLPTPRMVYAGAVHHGSGAFKGRGAEGGAPRTITVLVRGDVRRPGEAVGPGTVAFVPGVPSRFGLSPDYSEGEGRVALADWIVHQDNPLTWRTIVNRVWLYHFGRGIVDTPNDFGRMGQEPTHPLLLDWLAAEFRDGGQSIKGLHRLIVNSATYRQASQVDADSAEIDGSNRFLWRMNRRKLEAEALRDSILLVTDKLDTTMFGPGYYDFVLEKAEHSPHFQYHKHDPDDPQSHRRSIYRFLVRSQPAPFMDTLDCADPSLLVDKRNETLTALQALALLNNKFVVRMSEHFAGRVQDEEDPLARAIELALSREARPGELDALRAYAGNHGLAAACRIIFNLNEFAFVD
jgi:hypothetical protein